MLATFVNGIRKPGTDIAYGREPGHECLFGIAEKNVDVILSAAPVVHRIVDRIFRKYREVDVRVDEARKAGVFAEIEKRHAGPDLGVAIHDCRETAVADDDHLVAGRFVGETVDQCAAADEDRAGVGVVRSFGELRWRALASGQG